MKNYLIGGAALVVIALGFMLVSGDSTVPVPDAAAPESNVAAPAPAPSAPVAPNAVALPEGAPVSLDEDALLEGMAADTRESLPASVTDTLTMTDAMFLPRMRIMEYTYVTTVVDARASAGNMRALIEAGAERLCLRDQQMVRMGVTLRNSFEDRDGTLFQRVYLLPEDCHKFY